MRHVPAGDAAADVTAAEPPAFVRPSSPEIDVAKVMRRSDLSRTASRSALASSGLAGLALCGCLLTRSLRVRGWAIACGMVALVAVTVRVRLETAQVPHLDR